MTIASFTQENKTYETTPEHCNCPARHFNPGQQCKHQIALIQELNCAQKFLLLKTLFDVRNRPAKVFNYVEDGMVHTARRINWNAVLN